MAAITSSTIGSNLFALGMGVFPIAINQLVQRVFAQKTSPLKLHTGSLMASSVAYLILAQKLPTSFRLGAPVLFLAYKVALKHWNQYLAEKMALERWIEQNLLFDPQDAKGELPPPSTDAATPATTTPDKKKPGIFYKYPPPGSTCAAALHYATSPIHTNRGEDDGLEKSPASTPSPVRSATSPAISKQDENVDEPSGSKGETTQHSTSRQEEGAELKSVPTLRKATPPSTTSTKTRKRRNVVLHKAPTSPEGSAPPSAVASSPLTFAQTPELPPSAVTAKKTVSLASLVTPPKLEPFPPATKAEKTLTDQIQGVYANAQASVHEFEKLLKNFRASTKRAIHVESSTIVPGEARIKKASFKATIYFGETHLFKFDKLRVDALKSAGYNVTEETLFFWIEVKKNGEEKKLTTVNLIPVDMLNDIQSATQKFSLTLKDKDTQYVLNFDNQISHLKSFAATLRKCTHIQLVPEAFVNITASLKSPGSTKHQETVIEANNYATVHHAKCYLEYFKQ